MPKDKGGAGSRMAKQIRKDSGGKDDGGKAMMAKVRPVVKAQSQKSS